MTVGKKYKIKLTTQEVEGEIEEIVRVIDASNLDSSKANTTVALNDVAEVIIKTNEKVAFDKFSDINITGRFVLVEGYDVAGGGIITENEGLKEESLKGGFIHNGINARNDIFEEYYYESRDFSLTKEIINNNVYTIGDEVPLKGDSYDYPKDLDIIIFRDDVYVSIRNGKVTSLNELDYY